MGGSCQWVPESREGVLLKDDALEGKRGYRTETGTSSTESKSPTQDHRCEVAGKDNR